MLVLFWIQALLLDRDRAVAGSSQALSLIPGLLGQYLRRAFFGRVLARCHHTAVIEFGVLFSKAGACIDENVYLGPRCHIGLAHIGAMLFWPLVSTLLAAHRHTALETSLPPCENSLAS